MNQYIINFLSTPVSVIFFCSFIYFFHNLFFFFFSSIFLVPCTSSSPPDLFLSGISSSFPYHSLYPRYHLRFVFISFIFFFFSVYCFSPTSIPLFSSLFHLSFPLLLFFAIFYFFCLHCLQCSFLPSVIPYLSPSLHVPFP